MGPSYDTKFAVLFFGSQTVSWQSAQAPSQHCVGGRGGGGKGEGEGGSSDCQGLFIVAVNKAFQSFV